MATQKRAPPSEAEVLRELRARIALIPDCELVHSAVFAAGPKTYKVAALLEYRNPETGEVDHRELHLNDYRFTAAAGVRWEVKDRLGHWGCRDDEIDRLCCFLTTRERMAAAAGDGAAPVPTLVDVLHALRSMRSPDLSGVVAALSRRADDLRMLPAVGESDARRPVAAALRAAHRATALAQLRQLMDQDAEESDFQELLAHHAWMLGTMYVGRVPAREWSSETTTDMMLKTAENGLELIVVKRSQTPLVREYRKQLVVSADVNDAVNHAAQVIADVQRPRAGQPAQSRAAGARMRAKVLIGQIHENDPRARQKRASLEVYNGQLQHIQVLSFDELLRIGERIVQANHEESRGPCGTELPESAQTRVPF